MAKLSSLKILIIFILLLFIIPLISSCDQTLVDIFTQINFNYSGTRTVGIAVKTEYGFGKVLISKEKKPEDLEIKKGL